ncbi:MAG: hypothetical protein ABWY23_04455, partial [Mycetocola sp.]
LRQVKAGKRDLMEIVRNDPATVGPDQYLVDLFEPAAESQLPVAVVDDSGRLLGAIPRVTLLAALANVSTATGENQVIEPTATVAVDVITQTLRDTAGMTDEVDSSRVVPNDAVSASREGSLAGWTSVSRSASGSKASSMFSPTPSSQFSM